MSEHCEQHLNIAQDIAVIKNDIGYIKDKVCIHISQGEEKGGYRDRLIIVEQEQKVIKADIMKVGLFSGILGALLGNIAPEAFLMIARWVTGK